MNRKPNTVITENNLYLGFLKWLQQKWRLFCIAHSSYFNFIILQNIGQKYWGFLHSSTKYMARWQDLGEEYKIQKVQNICLEQFWEILKNSCPPNFTCLSNLNIFSTGWFSSLSSGTHPGWLLHLHLCLPHRSSPLNWRLFVNSW